MKIYLIFTFCFFSFIGFTQSEEESVKATINRFFEGMETNDTTKIRTTIDQEGAFLKSIASKKDGSTVMQNETIEGFFKQVNDVKDLKIKEQLLSFDIKIDGAMAIAWTPYKMFVNDKLSHCGVNVFTLIKRDNDWKIIGITDTRRREGCE